MENDTPEHSGLLQIPPHGKLILKKTWQTKFCLLYKASKSGIARIELFDSSEECTKKPPVKIITLEDCIKVHKKTSHLFTIVKKTATFDFNAITDTSLKEWVSSLQNVAFGDDSLKVTLVEDNDLYCSVDEGLFIVRVCQTEASMRCRLEPTDNYTLVLTSNAIRLHDLANQALLFLWPYQYIRRYGCRGDNFTFEAGRKCDSGEGCFFIEYHNSQEINRCLSKKMKEMKKQTDNKSDLHCGETQLKAVLNKEARSRSPLPPSPTTSTTLKDIENLSIQDSFDTSFSSSNSSFTKPLIKPKPIGLKPKLYIPKPPPKPPRKSSTHQQTSDSNKDDYETVDKYDSIQYRNNAWKTLGTTDIKHHETIEDEEYISWGQKTTHSSQNKLKASKVIMETNNDMNDYDKLDHFGSSGRLNNSGYKQVHMPNVNLNYKPSFHDYERVCPNFEDIRQADDSHLGYAVVKCIKKKEIQHEAVNNDDYAVINKLKLLD